MINAKTNTREIIGAQGFSVEQWIAGFRDADYVVTDSFHAIVFSIVITVIFMYSDLPSFLSVLWPWSTSQDSFS